MYKMARDWLKEGGAIQKDAQLYDELIMPETVARLDGKIQIEAKKELKARLGRSPNRADALILSFAMPMTGKPKPKPKITPYIAGGSGGQGWMG